MSKNIEDYVNLNIDDDEMATSINNLQNNQDLMNNLLENYNQLEDQDIYLQREEQEQEIEQEREREQQQLQLKEQQRQQILQQQKKQLKNNINNEIDNIEHLQINEDKNYMSILINTVLVIILFLIFNSTYIDIFLKKYQQSDITILSLKVITLGLIYSLIKFFIKF